LEAPAEFSPYIRSKLSACLYPNRDPHTTSISPSIDPPYPVYGGYFREESVMLLRRFYVQENQKGGFSAQRLTKLE
jgi:hypothetical protein